MKNTAKQPPVAIVGGGLAGLSAARTLSQYGIPFVLFEAGPQLAGMASSFRDDEGYTYDFGAHFITNRLAAALGAGHLCRDVHHYGEIVWLDNGFHGYPFGLASIPRMAAGALTARMGAALSSNGHTVTARDWFRREYGVPLADEVAVPLVEAWSGQRGDVLSAAVGEKFPGSVAQVSAMRLAGRLTKRAVAVGYARDLPLSPHVWHVYPQGGVSSLIGAVAASLLDNIELESPVQAIYVRDGRAVGVRVRERDMEVAAVISTVPASFLPSLVQGSNALEPLSQLRFRPMVFVNLRLEGRGLLPDTVAWFPQERFPFFRLTEVPLSMPWLAPHGRTLITADIGCEKWDSIWNKDDDALGEQCIDAMTEVIPDARDRYRGCRVLRTPIAYPVYHLAYEDVRQGLTRSSGIDRLLSVGRNGEFAHILMEDVHQRAQARTRTLVSELVGIERNVDHATRAA
jgi:protoporphyrinogen oxidase